MTAAIPVLLASLLLLAACGNRGSLYLPEEETVGAIPEDAAGPAPEQLF